MHVLLRFLLHEPQGVHFLLLSQGTRHFLGCLLLFKPFGHPHHWSMSTRLESGLILPCPQHLSQSRSTRIVHWATPLFTSSECQEVLAIAQAHALHCLSPTFYSMTDSLPGNPSPWLYWLKPHLSFKDIFPKAPSPRVTFWSALQYPWWHLP